MSPVELLPRPAPSAPGIAHLPSWLVAVAGVALALFVAGQVREPASVDRVDVVNSTPYELSVDVRPAGGGGWVPLGYVARTATTTVREVLDQGDRWTFRFEGQGRDGGEVQLSRARLEQDRWRITVPPVVEQRLRAAGAPPSP